MELHFLNCCAHVRALYLIDDRRASQPITSGRQQLARIVVWLRVPYVLRFLRGLSYATDDIDNRIAFILVDARMVISHVSPHLRWYYAGLTLYANDDTIL